MTSKKKQPTAQTADKPKRVRKPKKTETKPLIFPDGTKIVVIINFNTPELTEAAILSVRKHGGRDYQIVVFDNSKEATFPASATIPERYCAFRPFTKKMDNITILDNTRDQIIDFNETLSKYPGNPRHAQCNGCASMKHILTIQKLWELIPQGFVLLESDVLLKANIDFMFSKTYAVVGHVIKQQLGNRFGIGRVAPFLCYMNVPLLTKYGARYFDPERSWMLYPGEDDKRNWYDTGACLLDDVKRLKPHLKGLHVDIRKLMIHLQSGSWRSHGITAAQWLKMHEYLWR